MNSRLMSVMAPLKVKNKIEFKENLSEAKGFGIEAVTVDVWWGLVMTNRNKPDWSYYKEIFKYIVDANFFIVPIISFHRCGGGPGDGDCDIQIPKWVYSEVSAEANIEADDLRYESETGRKCSDYLPPWVTNLKSVSDAMNEFMVSFLEEPYYKELAKYGKFKEINISMGPTGELRYPSYNKADSWEFDHRGYFQAYSNPARSSFRNWVVTKSPEWSKKYLSEPFNIRPPFGHVKTNVICNSPYSARADQFVSEKQHEDKGYGRDFIQWYHDSLIQHCNSLLKSANSIFINEYLEVPFGIKIPGIHWQWRLTDIPRYAELTAGLIPYDSNLRSGSNLKSQITGYESFFKSIKQIQNKLNRKIIVHFTSLEMDDDNDSRGTSMAKSLVFAVGETAKKYGVLLSGENAIKKIAINGDDRTWENINQAFESGYFSGFTLLRLCEDIWNTDKGKYKEFIKKHDY